MKKTLICETTREQREQIVKDGIALSTLDCKPPTDFTMKLYQRYINGEIELDEVEDEILKHYGVA